MKRTPFAGAAVQGTVNIAVVEQFENRAGLHSYEGFVADGRPPTLMETAEGLSFDANRVARRPTPEEAQELFDGLGLTGRFWHLGP